MCEEMFVGWTLQKPLWCSTSYDQYACQDREYFFLGQLPYLNNVQSLIYEVTLTALTVCYYKRALSIVPISNISVCTL